jgi:prepilin-type N-terminal cleavage/methylation domain-containing protein
MLDRLKMRRERGGFTIIEVLIVLAIAGLIMVVVFLAVPNLQRSQRNNARKTDANNVLSAISDFSSNNGGQLPSTACTGSGTGSGQCAFLVNLNLGYFTASNIKYVPAGGTAPSGTPSSEQMWVLAGDACASGAASAPTTAQSTRGIAVYYGIEGSVSTQCIAE